MPPAIIVDDIWKQYLIGRARYTSLRDIIAGGWNRLLGRPAQSETERTREFHALKGVSFEVEQGSTLGIIGPNGAGKSTMLKVLSRVTKPTRGTVTTHGRVSALIEVGAGFHPELTGRENIYLNGSILGMKRKEIASKFDAIVDFSGLEQFIDTPVKYYSSGMFARLGFSVAAHVQPDILLVDEVLSVGDWGFQQKCFERMAEVTRQGSTVVFVSHNLAAVSSLCERGILLNAGKLVSDGDISSVLGTYSRAMIGQSQTRHSAEVESARLTAAKLLGDNGREKSTFQSGEVFQLVFDLCCYHSLRDVFAVVLLRDAKGMRLARIDTSAIGAAIQSLREGDRARFKITGRVTLLGGVYTLGVAIRQRDDLASFLTVDHLCSFCVSHSSQGTGTVAVDPAISVEVYEATHRQNSNANIVRLR